MPSIRTRTCDGIASIYKKDCSDWWVQVPLLHFVLEYKQLVWSIVGGDRPWTAGPQCYKKAG